MKNINKTILSSLIALIFSSACITEKASNSTDENGNITSSFNVNKYKLNELVCDPFDNGDTAPGVNDGLSAELFYLTANQPHYGNVQDYIDNGTKSVKKLFFSTVEVPTRLFDLGFPSETGQSIMNDQDEVLNEYFALRFKSVLTLAPEQEEGTYELALLSDDGAVLQIRDENGVYQTVVDNDGNHPTRMGCGQTIEMTHDKEVVVRLDYYQGPRYHISVIPMWRKVDVNTTAEPLCGQKGNSKFFDFNNNSKEQQAYKDLLSRNWKPIAAENWNLPAQDIFNPCTQGNPPIISNLTAVDQLDGKVKLTWQTNDLATSQVLYTNQSNGTEVMTDSDNVLRTSHEITISGLDMQTYEFKAVSISATLGKAISFGVLLSLQ